MEVTEEQTSERSVTPMKESIDETDKTRKLQTTEMETAFVQERAGHENSQDGKAPVRDIGELQIALDSAGSETPVDQPDGGLWGWIVCLTAMMNYGTVTGLINALSLVYVIMLKEFSEGDVSIAFKISWVSTLVLVTAMTPCILAGMLSDRFGIRRVAFTGGLLAFVGTLSSAFVKEVLLLYLTFGVLVGVGFSFTLSPSMAVLGHYFNKRLGLANGIMTCGGGVLSVGYVWILPVIYDHLGLRSMLLFMSGLSFLQIVYALTWIPTVHRERKPGDQQQELTAQRGENEQEDDVALNFTEDFGERNREQEDGGGVALNFTEDSGERNREQEDGGGVALNFTEDSGERNREQEDGGGVALNCTEDFGERNREQEDGGGVALNFTEDFGERNREQEDGGGVALSFTEDSGERKREPEDGGGVALSFTEDSGERKREPPCQSPIQKGRSPSERDAATAQRGPHSRVDGGRSCCRWKTRDAGLLNVRIWKNRRYVLWIVSSAISGFGYFVVAFHNVKFAKDRFPDSNGKILPICWSAGVVASRLLLIAIADRKRVRKYHVQIHQAVFFTFGATTMTLPLATDFVWLIIVVTIQGMCDGLYFCLAGPIAIKTVGVLDSSQAIGFHMGLNGISMAIGPSLAGLWYDYAGSYTVVFPVLGAPLLVGGALLFLLPYVAPAEPVNPSDDGTRSPLMMEKSSDSQGQYCGCQ